MWPAQTGHRTGQGPEAVGLLTGRAGFIGRVSGHVGAAAHGRFDPGRPRPARATAVTADGTHGSSNDRRERGNGRLPKRRGELTLAAGECSMAAGWTESTRNEPGARRPRLRKPRMKATTLGSPARFVARGGAARRGGAIPPCRSTRGGSRRRRRAAGLSRRRGRKRAATPIAASTRRSLGYGGKGQRGGSSGGLRSAPRCL